MSQDIIRSVPLKSGQKLPNSKPSDIKESRVRSDEENRDISCYLLIADVLIRGGDFKNANIYFKKAADLGNSYAQHELSFEDSAFHDYPKELLHNLVAFEEYCKTVIKTSSPRIYWLLASLYERSRDGAGKVKEYYQKASASGYLRAYIDLKQFEMFVKPENDEELMENCKKIISIDNAHILFTSSLFFETQFSLYALSQMGRSPAKRVKDPEYKMLIHEKAAEMGYCRAHLELGEYYKEKCLRTAYEHLKKAQNGFNRLLAILEADKGISPTIAFLKEQFQKDKELAASKLMEVEILIAQQPVAMLRTPAASIAKNQPPSAVKKTKSAIKREKEKRKAHKKASNVVTSPVVPQDTTNAASKNATFKSNELEKLPSVDTSEQSTKHQNNTVDVTTTPATLTEKKSTSSAKKEKASTAKKAPAASAITSAELPKLQRAINAEQKKEKATSNTNSKAEDRATSISTATAHQKPAKKKKDAIDNASQNQMLIATTRSTTISSTAATIVALAEKKASPTVLATTPRAPELQNAGNLPQKNKKSEHKASPKIGNVIASNPPVRTSQSLNPKKSHCQATDNPLKGQALADSKITSATGSASSAAKKVGSSTAVAKEKPKSNISQPAKTSTNAPSKSAVNTTSTSVSATSSVPASNCSTNYFSSSVRNNSQSTTVSTTARKTETTIPPAKTSPTPGQKGNMLYADLFKPRNAPTTSSAAIFSVDEIEENNTDIANAAQPAPVAPIPATTPAPANSEADKNFVATSDATPVNEEEPATAPTFAPQQPSVVAPPQTPFTYQASANFAADNQYGQIPPTPLYSVSAAMPIPVDPYMQQAMLTAYQAQVFQNTMAAAYQAQAFQNAMAFDRGYITAHNHMFAAWSASLSALWSSPLQAHVLPVASSPPALSSIALGGVAAAVGHFAPALASYPAYNAPVTEVVDNHQDNSSSGPTVRSSREVKP